jgi:hypothetical protein
MSESLGTAVLTLSTDHAQLLSGLDQAEKKQGDLRKAFDTTAKSAKDAGVDIGSLGKRMSESGSITDTLKGSMATLGATLVASLSVAAVTGAIKSYTEFTGKLADMSAKTGIGTEALQRLKYAAEQNGSTLDQVTTAVSKLGQKLAGGDSSAAGGLKALGLSFEDIRSMSPDKAFITIGDAIAKVEDPMARSKLAMDLFGKSGADLLPMLTGHLSETAAAADRLGIVMSDKAVQAGDRFGDTMSTLQLVGQSMMAQVLEPMIPALTTMALWLGENMPKAISGARDAFDWLVKKGLEVQVWFREFVLGVVELGAKVPLLGAKLGATSETITGLRAGVQNAKDAVAAFDAQTRTTGDTVTHAAGTMKTLNLNYGDTEKAAKAAEKTAKEHADALDTIRLAHIALTPEQQKSVIEWEKLNISASDMAKALGVNVIQVDQFVGNLRVMDKEIATVSASTANFAALFPNQVRDGNAEIGRMQIGFGVLHEKVTQLRDAKLEDFGTAVKEIEPKVSAMAQTATEAFNRIKTSIADNLTGALLHTQSFSDAFKGIWRDMKSSALSVVSEMLESFVKKFLGGMLDSMLGNKGAFTSAFGGMTSGFGGVMQSLTGSVTSAVAGWVGIATAAFAGIKKLWDSGFGRGGEEGVVVNPARDKWFDEHGGLAGVNEGLMNSGLSWADTEKLSKGVFGATTKSQFEAATEAVDRALGKLPKLAGGGIVTRPTVAMIGEQGPEAVVPLGKNGMGDLTVNVLLDSREVAHQVVPHIPGVVNLLVGPA